MSLGFPVEFVSDGARSTVLSGSANTSTASITTGPSSATVVGNTGGYFIGPFIPDIGRDIWCKLILSGGAVGSVQLLKSDDGGTTKDPLTAGATPYGLWTFDPFTGLFLNEQVISPSDSGTYYLHIILSAGSLTFRLGQ